MTSERREVWYRIPERDFFDLLLWGRFRYFRIEFVAEMDAPIPLPGDAVGVRSWREDFAARCFRVVFSHPQFTPVPDGAEPPYGGLLRLSTHSHPSTESISARFGDELDAAYAAIHDLTQQLKELGHEPGR